jgi:hypothetical protein
MVVLAGHRRQTALRFEVCRLGAVCARICARSIANIEARVAELADAPDLDCEIIDFKTSLFVPIRSRVLRGKPRF